MLQRTEGIILHTLQYSDHSIIAKIYTRQSGLQSYIIRGARSKKAKTKASLLQPLTLVDMVVMNKEKNALKHIQELNCYKPFATIPYNIIKSSIVLFLNEILYKSIHEEEANPALFEFIESSLQILDMKEDNYSNFHLSFLVQLTKYLGFFPQLPLSLGNSSYFDLREGIFKEKQPNHPFFADTLLSSYLFSLIGNSYENIKNETVPSASRRKVLSILIQYYELHLSTVKDIKSHHVLEQVMI